MTEEERQALWDSLYDSAEALGVPTPPSFNIGLRLETAEGGVLYEAVEEGHSWTRNGWNINFGMMTDAMNPVVETSFGVGHMSAKEPDGSVYARDDRAVSRENPYYGYGYWGVAGASGVGIVVGSGNTAFSVEDYMLDTAIEHSAGGTTDGTLEYRGQSAASMEYDSGTKIWTSTISREFKNNNTESPVVRETGLMWNGAVFATGVHPFLTARDVLATPITVAPTQLLTVNYILAMDFSVIDT
jgi:hypothetical protein